MARLKYAGTGDGDAHMFVTADGVSVSAYMAEGIPVPDVGKVCEVEIESKTSKAGKQYQRIVSIDGQKGTQRQGSYGRGRPPSYDPRTFVSNVVGQAIQSGLIDSPEQIGAWAREAYNVVQGLEGSAAIRTHGEGGQTPPSQPASPSPSPQQAGDSFGDVPF